MVQQHGQVAGSLDSAQEPRAMALMANRRMSMPVAVDGLPSPLNHSLTSRALSKMFQFLPNQTTDGSLNIMEEEASDLSEMSLKTDEEEGGGGGGDGNQRDSLKVPASTGDGGEATDEGSIDDAVFDDHHDDVEENVHEGDGKTDDNSSGSHCLLGSEFDNGSDSGFRLKRQQKLSITPLIPEDCVCDHVMAAHEHHSDHDDDHDHDDHGHKDLVSGPRSTTRNNSQTLPMNSMTGLAKQIAPCISSDLGTCLTAVAVGSAGGDASRQAMSSSVVGKLAPASSDKFYMELVEKLEPIQQEQATAELSQWERYKQRASVKFEVALQWIVVVLMSKM